MQKIWNNQFSLLLQSWIRLFFTKPIETLASRGTVLQKALMLPIILVLVRYFGVSAEWAIEKYVLIKYSVFDMYVSVQFVDLA